MTRSDKYYLLILFFAGAVIFALLKLFHFNGLYGQDSHEYLRYARELHDHFSAAHRLPTYLPLYPALGALLGFVLPIRDALQLISIYSLVLSAYVLLLCIRRFFPDNKYAFVFIFCFCLLSPYFFRASCSIMTDAPATLFLLSTFYFLLSYSKTSYFRYLFLALIFAVPSAFTRYAALAPLIVMFACFIALHFNVRVIWRVGVPLLLLLGAFILYKSGDVFHISTFPVGHDFALSNIFKRTFSSEEGFKSYALPNILTVFYPFVHPGFIFAGVLFLAATKKEVFFKKEVLLCIIPAIAYLFLLCCFPQQNPRHEILVFPFVLILYAPAFERIMNGIKQKTTFVVGSVVLQLAFIFFSMKSIYAMSRQEQTIAAYLKPLPKEFRYIYQLGNEGIVQSYDVDLLPLELYGDTLKSLRDA